MRTLIFSTLLVTSFAGCLGAAEEPLGAEAAEDKSALDNVVMWTATVEPDQYGDWLSVWVQVVTSETLDDDPSGYEAICPEALRPRDEDVALRGYCLATDMAWRSNIGFTMGEELLVRYASYNKAFTVFDGMMLLSTPLRAAQDNAESFVPDVKDVYVATLPTQLAEHLDAPETDRYEAFRYLYKRVKKNVYKNLLGKQRNVKREVLDYATASQLEAVPGPAPLTPAQAIEGAKAFAAGRAALAAGGDLYVSGFRHDGAFRSGTKEMRIYDVLVNLKGPVGN